jgi:ribosomal-protein-alanine N-acetyltransferase
MAALDGQTDGVVAIRRVTVEDAPAFAQAFRDDPSLGISIGIESDPTEAEVVSRVEAGTGAKGGELHAIADARTGAFLGTIGIFRIDEVHGHGEVGFWLVPGARGRGIASRAVRLATSFGFDSLGFHRVEMTTTADNAPTRSLGARVGFLEEGVMRERNFERGRRVDIVMLAVLKSEWQ